MSGEWTHRAVSYIFVFALSHSNVCVYVFGIQSYSYIYIYIATVLCVSWMLVASPRMLLTDYTDEIPLSIICVISTSIECIVYVLRFSTAMYNERHAYIHIRRGRVKETYTPMNKEERVSAFSHTYNFICMRACIGIWLCVCLCLWLCECIYIV